MQNAGAATFTDDDLRYRQLAMREQPATQAVVIPAMDVSSSMTRARPQAREDVLLLGGAGTAPPVHAPRARVRRAHDRSLGVPRRRSSSSVTGTGGTVASAGLQESARDHRRALRPRPFNVYVFYASDGENFPTDRRRRRRRSTELGRDRNYVGYLEVAPLAGAAPDSRDGAAVRARSSAMTSSRRVPRRAAPTTSGTRCAHSSAAARVTRSETTCPKIGSNASPASSSSRARQGLDYYPRRVRRRARKLHDGDRRSTACRCACRTGRSACATSTSSMQHRMGLSRLFEVVFPGNPGRAYLAKSNSRCGEHAGHGARARPRRLLPNNLLFRRSQDQVGENIVEQAAAHARQIGMAIEEHGLERVESVLDAALALEQHIDTDKGLRRARYAELVAQPAPPPNDEFSRRFAALGPDTARQQPTGRCEACAGAAASGARPAVVHRSVRAGAGAVGARHLPRRARRVVLLLSGVRVPDHERRLGVVLARATAARSGLPAAVSLCRRDQVPLGRRTPERERSRASRSRPIRITSASRSGKRSSKRKGSMPRARSCARTTTSRSCATT